MAVPINRVIYFNDFNFKATTVKTSGPCEFVGVQGVIFFCFSDDEDGILNIDIKVASQWRELTEETVLKGKLHVVDIDFFIPEARVRFTPDAAPTKFTATAHGYPSVYIRKDTNADGSEKDQI
jgi:hypothetical protein